MELVKKIGLNIIAAANVFSLKLLAQNETQFSHITVEDGLSLNVVSKGY
jgi:hypothetical protein